MHSVSPLRGGAPALILIEDRALFAREVLNERCTNRVADDFGRCLKSRKLRDKNLRHISERLPNESFIGKNIRAARQKYE
ncbi:hypothetical protein TWF102_003712 [Orbilia oligospora]|uniref:Uncharacterized protein n=1 Tax=Orbilia oligospora TaxID=2813651 RepID=A0A7C8J956_ORBOL|nr:hypothetical protein TWF102_003712 [Orbilia oligospora]